MRAAGALPHVRYLPLGSPTTHPKRSYVHVLVVTDHGVAHAAVTCAVVGGAGSVGGIPGSSNGWVHTGYTALVIP